MEEREPSANARRLLRRVKENRIDREYVRTTIESPGWRVFFERVLKPTLDDWRRDLVTRVEMPEAERRGTIMARTTLLEGIRTLYDRTGAPIPEWFEKELSE